MTKTLTAENVDLKKQMLELQERCKPKRWVTY